MKRKRTGNNRVAGIDRVRRKELITLAKAAGLKLGAVRRWLVSDTVTHARTIIDGTRLEFDPHSIKRTLKATKKLTQELTLPSNHVQQLYHLYLSPEARRSARSIGEIKSDLERLSTGLEVMLDRLKPSRGAPRLGAIEDYVFASAFRWKQAGGNPGRQTPGYKQRVGFGEKTERGPFGQFLRLAFEAAGGDPSQITEAKIKDGLKRSKTLMEKNNTE